MFEKLLGKAASLLSKPATDQLNFYAEVVQAIRKRAGEGELPEKPVSLTDSIAAASLAIERVLGLRPFDVQLLGAVTMTEGKIAEMQTGEGKTLTAVMSACYFAANGHAVHVLTANDYLARRDAEWMGPVYRELGFTVGFIQQGMTPDERRAAYDCDIVYATPNEVGFDLLRDGLALKAEDLVHRDFDVALIDEADSILIDEARIPLVIAGGEAPPKDLVESLARIAKALQRHADYQVDEHGRNVLLTDLGTEKVERALGVPNLYDDPALFTAVSDALHAQVLLRRDVDYIVRGDEIQIVDEFKGRIAELRRWPAGLQTALEAKEALPLRTQGRILGSITLQSLVRLYPKLCGMTGTALTQAEELWKVYGLEVVSIPTHRPMIRVDQPDHIYRGGFERDAALLDEIAAQHAAGRPVLVGTASVADSERISRRLQVAAIPHRVLNARNDAEEAAIVAQAGQRGAVTISTNMAGRGTDIQLGDGVAALGGLYVIGTARHEARRIDHQLRGRAGRQGDPGESRFFLSLEDDLMVRFGLAEALRTAANPVEALEHIQRVIEGENLEVRKTLLKYDQLIENQRRMVQSMRLDVLLGERECPDAHTALLRMDDLWSQYIATIAEMKSGIHWVSFGGKNPLDTFLHDAANLFEEMLPSMEEAIRDPASCAMPDGYQRGATWTYVTTDQPLGDMNLRLARGIMNKVRAMIELR
ncbi:MAG: accessory Sec system translocase SecA2 [Acidobacteria bacterium]|nr:accessory Sec system translocase SecA2 [Acidobacteriota bacterium]